MKRLIPAAIALLFIAVTGLVLGLAAKTFAATQERSITYRYFAEALHPVEPGEQAITWNPPARTLVRDFNEADEFLVGQALDDAWRAHALAMSTGDTGLLPDYMSGVALQRSMQAAESAQATGAGMAVMELAAAPYFYHLDGSVVQIASDALTVRFAITEGALRHFRLSRDQVMTTLMNETTGWRVFTHEMSASEPVIRSDHATPDATPLHGINYYPANTPWRDFWPGFDAEIIAADLDLIAGLGGNAVRIFLPQEAFATERGDKPLEDLATFLQLSADRGLQVVPTLFDMKSGYGPATWSDDMIYLRRVLPILAGSPVVPFIDLKNEPDLDFATHGEALVTTWAQTMITVSDVIAPTLDFTIGWAAADPAARYPHLVDIVSYHDYAPIEGTADRLATVRQAAGARPVYVTEIGASAYGAAASWPGSPEGQAEAIATRMAALREADGVFVWTLHDFPQVDADAVGGSPWVKRLQAEYGLFDMDGAEKPAAAVVRDSFAQRAATQRGN